MSDNPYKTARVNPKQAFNRVHHFPNGFPGTDRPATTTTNRLNRRHYFPNGIDDVSDGVDLGKRIRLPNPRLTTDVLHNEIEDVPDGVNLGKRIRLTNPHPHSTTDAILGRRHYFPNGVNTAAAVSEGIDLNKRLYPTRHKPRGTDILGQRHHFPHGIPTTGDNLNNRLPHGFAFDPRRQTGRGRRARKRVYNHH